MIVPAAHILFVDNDEASRQDVDRYLHEAGYRIETFSDGFPALQRRRVAALDVVIVDHYVRDLDGLAFLKEVRGMPAAPPVIYLTGSDESRIAVAALKAGASDYLVKN